MSPHRLKGKNSNYTKEKPDNTLARSGKSPTIRADRSMCLLTQHTEENTISLCGFLALSAYSESNDKETSDKPTLRDSL